VDNIYEDNQTSIIEMEGGTKGRVPARASMHLTGEGAHDPGSRI